MKKKESWKIVNVTFVVLPTILGFLLFFSAQQYQPEVIKIGILHSITGTMAISEKPIVDAVLLAIKEINQNGGLLGKLIDPIIADGQSNPKIFAQEAERLIKTEKAVVIFGCWTSSSRKMVKTVVEKYNSLLFYPAQSEGLEQSPNIIYTGATPNQQILPGVAWCFDQFGKRFYLVGSENIFSHATHEIIREYLKHIDGKIIGESYLPLGNRNVSNVVKHIHDTKPDVILNTISGSTNTYFFKSLYQTKIPTMSFNIAENEFQLMKLNTKTGNYVTSSYFQSILTKKNIAFIEKLHKKYGSDAIISAPAETAYFSVHLWAQVVKEMNSTNINLIKEGIKNESINAPEGVIFVNSKVLNTWKTVRIGKITQDRQFAIVWDSEKPIPPVPYPPYKTKKAWNTFLLNLYNRWGQQWK